MQQYESLKFLDFGHLRRLLLICNNYPTLQLYSRYLRISRFVLYYRRWTNDEKIERISRTGSLEWLKQALRKFVMIAYINPGADF